MNESLINKEFDELKNNYEKFLVKFPAVKHVTSNVFYHMVNESRTKENFVEMALTTRPFLSSSIWNFLPKFMDFMRNLPDEEGFNYREVYKNFTQADLVKRLLFQRPVVFCGTAILRDSKIFDELIFLEIHKYLNPRNDGKPCLREYISFDEILLSSLINMSTPTYYVSDGSIKIWNMKSENPHIEKGVLCGLVGARNTFYNFLEHRYIFPLNDKHSTEFHKSDKFWIEEVYPEAFPERKIPTEEEIVKNKRIYGDIYVDFTKGQLINKIYFEKRLMFTIIPFILEAISRGVEAGKNVFCSVPPIGAGVWAGKIDPSVIHQLIVNGIVKYFDNNFDYPKLSCLKALALPTITDKKIYLNYKPRKHIQEIKMDHDDTISLLFKHPKGHTITIFNKIRYVAALLPPGFEDCLSVAGYAWDGNSYTGNEYWGGQLHSFDPQAVYCSLLGQFQNPEVNTKMADSERIKIY